MIEIHAYRIVVSKPEGKRQIEYIDLDERIILKWILIVGECILLLYVINKMINTCSFLATNLLCVYIINVM
jgi:hypothetical protein